MKETYTINMSSPEERALFLNEFAKLRGMHTFTVQRAKDPKSNADERRAALRRLYFVVYVSAYKNYLAAQGQPFTRNLCHYLLKRRFLKNDILDETTGEIIGEAVGSIADGSDVDLQDMQAFVRNVHQFLANELRIDLPELPGARAREVAA